jgi:TIR domain
VAHEVFISHSTEDKAAADAVCATLESRKIRCWIAPRDILGGMRWGEAISHAISESRIMVLVLSGHSNRSDQVTNEVQEAVNSGTLILPLRIQEVEPSEAIGFFIRGRHWLDAMTPPFESHLQHLADAIEELLSRICPNCRALVDQEQEVCTSCGHVLRPSEPPRPPRRRRERPPEPVPPVARGISLRLNRSGWSFIGASYTVEVANQGEGPESLDLEATSGQSGLRFTLPPRLELEPYSTQRVKLHVSPLAFRLFGEERHHSLRVSATAGGSGAEGPSAAANGQFDDAPRGPVILAALGGVLALIILAVVLLRPAPDENPTAAVAGAIETSTPSPAPTIVRTTVPTETPLPPAGSIVPTVEVTPAPTLVLPTAILPTTVAVEPTLPPTAPEIISMGCTSDSTPQPRADNSVLAKQGETIVCTPKVEGTAESYSWTVQGQTGPSTEKTFKHIADAVAKGSNGYNITLTVVGPAGLDVAHAQVKNP